MRALRALLALPLIAAMATISAEPAAADGEDWRIPRYQVEAEVAADGVTTVVLDLDFDFGSEAGHGPYLTLPLRQAITGDPDHWRMLSVEVGEVRSPSGANAEVETTSEDGSLLVRVGSEARTYTGVQSYRVSYTISGLIAGSQEDSGLDEFNWNAVGPGWEVPIDQVEVKVSGPVDVVEVACWTQTSFDRRCDQAAKDGSTATFSQQGIGDGDPLQVVAGFPAGTFTGVEPVLTTRYHVGNMFPLTPLSGGLAAGLTALGLGWVLLRTRRGSRDQVYLGLTPGLTPAAGQETSIGRRPAAAPVAVAFTPPEGARPGEIGVLIDSVANNSDISASLIDLAVRGYLTIEPAGDGVWNLTEHQAEGHPERQLTGAPPTGYEKALLRGIFKRGQVVSTADLGDEQFAGLLEKVRTKLYRRVSNELKWFTRNPFNVRAVAIVAGAGLVIAGVLLGLALGFVGLGLVGLAGIVIGTTVVALSHRFGVRTPTGSAVLAQAKGFELYLTTAEADQIRFEEGVDIYSRYLPYAMVFGVAERWTAVFEELAARGSYVPDGSWYVGYNASALVSHGFASSLDQLASTMSSGLQSATAASSGGSGFSGGGGGGGFGGGGGGGW